MVFYPSDGFMNDLSSSLKDIAKCLWSYLGPIYASFKTCPV
jgi:hypothetical protein